MTPEIKLEKFQGPLDLLLQLIELEKLNITEVSLSQITEQFLNYLDKMEKDRSEELADFLVIATKLVYLKSKTLLPYLYPEEEEGPSLADQLKMYQQYILASKKINILWSQNRIAYGRIEPPVKNTEFVLPLNARAADLLKSMEKLVSRLRPLNPLPKITIDRAVSVKQKVDSIWNALKQHKKMNFKDLLSSAENKTEVIVSFLALLELMREQKAFINQDSAFGSMEINLV
ncbi:MAG: Chromosome segregation and condensation protein [uncultured bacterium]|nr:MAG: Chromosome segregation and condensation protein [uncultured bacterium]